METSCSKLLRLFNLTNFLFYIESTVIFSLYSQDNNVITRDDLVRFTEEIEEILVPDVVISKLFQYVSLSICVSF